MSNELGYDPKGPTEPIEIVSSEGNEYLLSDGTKVRSKAVLLTAIKMVGQYNDRGEPICVLQWSVVAHVEVPDGLKKK
jgi:hypothetical protein